MTYDATYIALRLMRCGLWDEALAILPSGATALRAELLTDRFWWRLDGQAEAERAVAALYEEDGLLAAFLDSQLAYTRLLFDLSPRPDDLARARDGFDSVARDQRLAGWGLFWRGATADLLEKDEAAAASFYARALADRPGSPAPLLPTPRRARRPSPDGRRCRHPRGGTSTREHRARPPAADRRCDRP